MVASLYRIGTISAALVLLLPYAMRFDLVLLGRLPLRGRERWRFLWPLASWVRALVKPGSAVVGGSGAVAFGACALLLGAGALALGAAEPRPVWALALLGGGRLALAGSAPGKWPGEQSRSGLLLDGLGASVAFALALAGTMTLASQSAPTGAVWLALHQPLALAVACLAVAADPLRIRAADSRADAACHFQLLHAGSAQAWLESARYAWWAAGTGLVVAFFFPSLGWPWRLVLLAALLAALLWLRDAYVTGLRARLDWWFWPVLTALAAASLVVTLLLAAAP